MASFLARLGIASAARPDDMIQTIDANEILFSIPTISNDIAQIEPLTAPPGPSELIFHEDDWSQTEFFPAAQLENVKRLLGELKSFERANREGIGWRDGYIRKIRRVPVIVADDPVRHLARSLGAAPGPAPLLTAGGEVVGRVKDGFTLLLGGGFTLYGYAAGDAIPVLGVHRGGNPDQKQLLRALAILNGEHSLFLVDWLSQLVLLAVDRDFKTDTWKP